MLSTLSAAASLVDWPLVAEGALSIAGALLRAIF